jgi:DNA-binding winged helix-turn-helix (wHTH) protein/tetratricopeptide (TPR) repeat protein
MAAPGPHASAGRAGSAAAGECLRVGDWRLDPGSQRLIRGDTEHTLDPKQMSVLAHLAERAPELVTLEALLARSWPGVVVGDNSVHKVVAQLRRLLGDDARRPRYIETLARRGYRLVAPVTASPGDVSAAGSQYSGIRPLTERIVVGRFHRDTDDAALAALCAGFREGLIEVLATRPTVRIIETSLGEQADYEVHGRLQRAANGTTVSVRLIDVSAGELLWAHSFERPGDSLADLNPGQVAAVVGGIVWDHRRIETAYSGMNAEARREAIRASIQQHRFAMGAGGNQRVAMEHWRRALDLDPRFLWAAINLTAVLANRTYQPGSLDGYTPLAHDMARRVLSISHAHFGGKRWEFPLARVLHEVDLDFDTAEQLYLRAKAVGMPPQTMDLHLGGLYIARGDFDQAIIRLKGARDFALGPDQSEILVTLGWARAGEGRYRRAMEDAQAALAWVSPGSLLHRWAQRVLIQASWHAGHHDQARRLADGHWQRYADTYSLYLPGVMALVGRSAEARALLEATAKRHAEGRLGHCASSFLGHYFLGDLDQAFVWLDRVIDNRETMYLGVIRYASFLEGLRGDPRYHAAIARLNAIEAQGSPLRADLAGYLD